MVLPIRPVPCVESVPNYLLEIERRQSRRVSTDCLLFLAFCGVVAFLDSVLLAFVFALLGSPVPFGTFLMVNVRLGIDPDLPVAAPRRLRSLRRRNGFGRFLWSRRHRRRSGWGRRRRRALFRRRLFPVFLCGAGGR